jgi:hypothetical protein
MGQKPIIFLQQRELAWSVPFQFQRFVKRPRSMPNGPQRKGWTGCPYAKFCWYTFTPVRPNRLYLFRRTYFVLFRKGGLCVEDIPFAVLYFPIVLFCPHCRPLTHQQRAQISAEFGFVLSGNARLAIAAAAARDRSLATVARLRRLTQSSRTIGCPNTRTI